MNDSLDRFRIFLGVFMPLSILHSCFKFHVIRITIYGVIAEKPRVSILGQIFPCTLCVGSKINDTFSDGHDDLYHHAKFGEDRTMCAGCRCKKCGVCFLPAGCREATNCGIKFTHRPKIRFFAPQGRLVAPVHFKLGRSNGHVGSLA